MSNILDESMKEIGFELPELPQKKEVKMEQQKINMEFKLSKNYNSVMLGIQDEPIVFGNEEQLRQGIRKIAKVLREEVENQLSLIGTKEGG